MQSVMMKLMGNLALEDRQTQCNWIKFIKKREIKDYKGQPIEILDKDKGYTRYIVGGFMFGLGWALVGACPGPIFILLGTGMVSIFVVLLGALLGTFIYGLLKEKLPH